MTAHLCECGARLEPGQAHDHWSPLRIHDAEITLSGRTLQDGTWSPGPLSIHDAAKKWFAYEADADWFATPTPFPFADPSGPLGWRQVFGLGKPRYLGRPTPQEPQ